jgi:hypothetical protein
VVLARKDAETQRAGAERRGMVNDCLRFEISKLKARGAVFGSQRREGAKVRGMGSGDEPASIAAPRQSSNAAARGARADGSRGG